jgi:tryptophan synthase beta subunit
MPKRFGQYGGQYIPETLMPAVLELEKAYGFYKIVSLAHEEGAEAVKLFIKEIKSCINQF